MTQVKAAAKTKRPERCLICADFGFPRYPCTRWSCCGGQAGWHPCTSWTSSSRASKSRRPPAT
jgi:hypothetical protein